MTVMLDLRPEVEARLRDKAAASGLDLPAYLQKLAERDAAGAERDAAIMTDEEEEERLHHGILRGLVDEAAGRVKPLAQVVAEARQKHGFPETWPFGGEAAK